MRAVLLASAIAATLVGFAPIESRPTRRRGLGGFAHGSAESGGDVAHAGGYGGYYGGHYAQPAAVGWYGANGCWNCGVDGWGDWGDGWGAATTGAAVGAATGASVAAAANNSAYDAGYTAGQTATAPQGKTYAALPPGCTLEERGGYPYYFCSSSNAWLAPAYGANGVYYQVVAPPTV